MEKDKNIFSRQSIKDVNMQVVIVRLDFAGVSDSNDLVKLFDKKFPKSFRRRSVVENREININFRESDFKSISDSLSLPINAIKKERFVRYEGMENCSCDVCLDMSQFYLCLTIKCQNNYDGITNYVAPFKGAINLFIDKIPYFTPKRLGIRKVRVETKPSIDDFRSIFEPFVFPRPFYIDSKLSDKKSEYIDIIEEDLTGLRVNIRRELGLASDSNGGAIYSTSLDIDAYYHEEVLTKNKINEMINYANEREFEIYRDCMTYEYLDSISRKKKQ